MVGRDCPVLTTPTYENLVSRLHVTGGVGNGQGATASGALYKNI